MSLRDKLLKNSTIKETATLAESKIYGRKDMIPTKVPMINVALGGTIDSGIVPGLTMLAGPSKHFKSGFSLLLADAFLTKYPDGIVLFYDSEFGTPQEYFSSFGIDSNKVVHTPITDIEQLKFDLSKQLNDIERKDHVLILIDSIGNLASKKEVEDALNEKSVADMSRAKQLKSLFRIATPHLTIKDIPMVVVNHTYKEQCLDGATLIKTTDGNKPIKDINVGDYVYAKSGLQEVLATYGPQDLDPTDKKYLEIEFDDGSVVKCTHDHKFLTKDNKWVRAIDLYIDTEMY